MTTTFDAMRYLLLALGADVRRSTTTSSGSTTTAVDSARTERADFWNEGTVFIESGTYINSSRRVTDFASGTITFTPALGGAVASGVTYSIVDGGYPRDKLLAALNTALFEISLPAYDVTMTTVADQESYDLPAACDRLMTLDIADDEDATNYVPSYNWRQVGSKVYFDPGTYPAETGLTIRVGYNAPQTSVSADTDVIDDRIPIERLAVAAAVHYWTNRLVKTSMSEAFVVQFLNAATARAESMKLKHPLPRLNKYPRLTL